MSQTVCCKLSVYDPNHNSFLSNMRSLSCRPCRFEKLEFSCLDDKIKDEFFNIIKTSSRVSSAVTNNDHPSSASVSTTSTSVIANTSKSQNRKKKSRLHPSLPTTITSTGTGHQHKKSSALLLTAPKTERVHIFYYNDGFISKEHKLSQDLLNVKRRRALAYVWIPPSRVQELNPDVNHLSRSGDEQKTETSQGYIFYGGCVFNPFSKENGDATTTTTPASTTTTTIARQSVFHKKNNRITAVERLKKMPVIMSSRATSHKEVQKEITKAIFELGVGNKRLSGKLNAPTEALKPVNFAPRLPHQSMTENQTEEF